MKKLAFKLRFAWKNIARNFGNSLSVFLSLVLTAMLVVIAFNMRQSFANTFYFKDKEAYQDIDIVITFDESATARLVNKRKLATDYQGLVRSPLVFFNLFVLSEAVDETFYTELMSSSVAEMERLIDYDLENLSSGEVILTKSLADKYRVGAGDEFKVLMLGEEYVYTVNQIIPDTGLFAGDKIFVDKNRLIGDFYGLEGLDNLGNTIYVDVIDEGNIDTVMEMLFLDEEYADYLIFKTIDQEAIASKSLYNSTIMIGIVMLVVIALGMVIHSLFPLLSRKLERQYGLIRILGGENRFVLAIWIFEILIMYAVAAVVGSVFAFMIINFSSRNYGVSAIIFLDAGQTFLALTAITLLLALEGWIRFANIKKQSIVSLSSDYRYHKVKPAPYLLLAFAALAIVISLTTPFSYPINSLIVILASIFAAFAGISILLLLIQKLAAQGKVTLFERFNLRYLRDNRYIHHSLKILFASFLVIVIALSIRTYIKNETMTFKNQLGFDYAITNIFDYDESLLDEIREEFSVSHASAMAFSNEAYFALDDSEDLKLFNFCVMMAYDDFVESYAFHVESSPSEELIASKAAFVMLPSDYRYTHLLEIGDNVSLHTDGDYGIISLTVGGFFDVSYPNIVYTNLPEVEAYADGFKINTVIVESDADILTSLAQKYGEEMYYVVPIDNLIAYYGSLYQTAGDLALVLVGVIVTSFMIVIVNNTLLVFQTLKSDYAKLRTLGVANKIINKSLAAEAGISLAVICLFFIPEIYILSVNLPKLMLFFNYHREIIPGISTILLGSVLVALAFMASYLIYILKVRNLDLIGEIKYE